MPQTQPSEPTPNLDLGLTRWIPAAPELLFRAWTEPALIQQWFCPPPWQVLRANCNPRPGGAREVWMQGPDGASTVHRSVHLEVVPGRRLVFTDAYSEAWQPSPTPFMTGILTFEPEGQGTRYTAQVRHWTQQAYDQHLAMGFEQGWGVATDQMAALVARL